MIESVYSSENGEYGKSNNKTQNSFRMPKNIRQIGKSNATKKIYVEDYVMTFIKQLAGEEYSKGKIAVLVGQYVKMENSRNLFISGAIEVEEIDTAADIVFTNDAWTSIYENIKKYFVDAEILGWFFGGPGYLLEDKEKLQKIHMDNFAGQDKTLLTYDNMEKEEAFWFYENNGLCKQEGYYIYYERNEEMQNYMIEHNKNQKSAEADYDDHVSKEIRTIIQNKKPLVEETNKSMQRLMYAAGTLLAVIILIVGAAMLNNYDQMKTMQKTLESLSKTMSGENVQTDKTAQNQEGNLETMNKSGKTESAGDIGGSLEVTIIPGDLKPQEDDSQGNNEEASESASGKQEDTKTSSEGQNATQDNKKPTQEADANKNTSAETQTEKKYYTVKSGDSLAGISLKLYKSLDYVKIIKEMNNLEDENMIYIGQKLLIP